MSNSTLPLANFSTLGDLLKFLRRRAHLSQRELAIAVGYSESHLSRIEHNERPLDRTSLLALFVPALHLQNEPEIVKQLLALCADQPAPAPDPPPVASSQPPVYHLPTPLTSFVGRSEEIDEVCALLQKPTTRLLTLTGSGGCGKTRLAMRVAEALAPHYNQGMWLVELAALADPKLLPKTVATVVGLGTGTDTDILTDLTTYLYPRRALLILDNCEHLVAAAAQVAAALLHGCPHLQILATSREALSVPGEINYCVQPLALPPYQRGLRPLCTDIAHYDAIRLFVERARAVLHTFALTDRNAPAVTQICQRLDGIPLGIELAAAWVNVLSPEEIANHLAKDFALLVDNNRIVLPRHQTLRAAIDWSYNLLNDAEQTLLRRLAVFVGGWSMEAAEAIVIDDEQQTLPPASSQVLKLLKQLVNKSLVVVDHPVEGAARFRLLAPLCEYLQEKLAAASEEAPYKRRHLCYFLTLSQRLMAQLHGPTQVAALLVLDRELDNLRSALTWGLAPDGSAIEDNLKAITLAEQLGGYWYKRQQWREGRAWLTKALTTLDYVTEGALSNQPPMANDLLTLRADLLLCAGHLAGGQGELPTAQHLLAQSLTLQRHVENRRRITRCLQELATIANEQGDYARATAYLTESLAHAQSLADEWLYAISLAKLADVAGEQNDYARCEKFSTELLQIARRRGDIGMLISALNLLAQCAIATARCTEAVALLEEAIALDHQGNPNSAGSPWALRNLALAWQMCGNYAQAADDYRRSLVLRWERQQINGAAWALEGLGEVAALSGYPMQAARLWGAAATFRQSGGSVMSDSDRLRNAPMVATVRSQLGDEAFKSTWTAGALMAPEEAVAYALMAETALP
ncbi:MAG: serine/threonine protein kinase [Caldilinea sp. CFX5]|nr:serine/threonine protein kinase [Caldilinea sp. CFX5]